MTRYIISFIVLLISATAMATVRGINDIPNVHVADSMCHVSDPDNILKEHTKAELDNIIQKLWQQTSAEMAVVVIEEASDDPDSFATKLFTEWGIGKSDNDNGLLLLVALNQNKIVIRTGYGMEGIVPDIIAGRIIRDIAIPRFREGDIDGGVRDATIALYKVITDPDVRDELKSAQANNELRPDISTDDVLRWWTWLGIVAAVAMAIVLICAIKRTRQRDPYERYHALHGLLVPMAISSVIGLGIPLAIWILTYVIMRRVRTRPRICSNCGHKMRRLDETSDNAYLTPAQDTEERINSVDYDVWLCDNCGETDILPFVNKATNYRVCPRCHARACILTANRIMMSHTTTREGYGTKTYTCHNCHNSFNEPYRIPRAEPPVVILPSGGGMGGGGGFSGGSFGGGNTGGGGASGSW